MKADEKDIEEIIQGKIQYLIPLYQRAYVWEEKKHWQVLWDDLVDLASVHEQKENHFFGSFVTMPLKDNEKVKKFLLIDGQQRLTTIFIILAAINNEANAASKDLADEIKHDYLFNTYRSKSIKLIPTKLQGDRECFEQIIRGKECIINNRINDAFMFFVKKVSKTEVALDILTQVITRNLKVVHIELGKNDDPYKIFESLNAKGEELSQADLIRNYFFMRIHDEKEEKLVQEHYDDYWQPIQQKLDKKLDEFIRHYLMKEGAMVKEKDIYFTLKKSDDKKTANEVIKSLKNLAKFANYYERLLYPDKEKNQEISERISRLNQIEVTVIYPLLLNIYADYDSKPRLISEAQFIEILDLLENFLVRRFICQEQTRGLNRVFSYLYGKISQYGNFIEGLKVELSEQKYPDNSQFMYNFKKAQLYVRTGSRKKITKLILGRLENFQNKEPVNINHSDITIEHIMPQTLTLEWKKMLGDDYKSIHKTLCNTIGNLTLSGVNSKLAQKSFSEKQKILRNGSLRLNRYFADLNQWDEEAIRNRATDLAKKVLEIWPYFGELQTSSNLTDLDMKGKKPLAVIIMGDSYAVSSWRDVVQKTLEVIIDIDNNTFIQVVEKFPHYVALKDNFRSSRQLSNGYYLETNVDARSIYKFCQDIIELSELSSDDWKVELID
ncbi:DUF262 domain-containing HNH endonuclease family protein [Candidatus Halobeggiatoa sp. HSG11]|nr:DUF262 domain-containing HNH endonuclease family protein [Candidatus Halobeggiatoa sp. HSG11]